MKKRVLAVFCSLALTAASACAAGLDELTVFLKNTTSATGEFSQTVKDAQGREDAQAAGQGRFAFLRPGCFSWHYAVPFEERMVSDGKTLWLYDTELAQVTVKKLTAALPASPASLLFGQNDFTKDFNVKNLPSKDDLAWVIATPKDSASAFAEVRIAFDKNLPREMTLKDNFGQETRLVFKNVQTNVKLNKNQFTFKIPAGVDVLEDKSGL